MSNYLIILNEADATDAWGFVENPVARGIGGSALSVQAWSATDWLALARLGLPEPWIVVYSGIQVANDNEAASCKKKLATLVGHGVRIFHHGGAINLSDPYSKVIRKFNEAGFVAAGFSDLEKTGVVMPFSDTGATDWPWNSGVIELRDRFLASAQPQGNNLLEKAWHEAVEYFGKEAPMETVLTALFPLYIDACNFLSIGEESGRIEAADLNGAIIAGREAWKRMGSSIQEAVTRMIADPNDNDGKALRALKDALDGLSPDRDSSLKRLTTAFECFSTKFTEKLGVSCLDAARN